jgi:hypothetical protein
MVTTFLTAVSVRRWAWTALLVLGASSAAAQVGLGPAMPMPPAGRAAGLTPQIETILKQMLAAYEAADAYRDAGRITVRQTTGRIRQTTEMPSAIVFRRPNLLSVVGGAQSLASDGRTLQIVLDALRQYTSSPAPPRLTMEDVRMGAPGAGLDQGYPEVLEFLLGEEVYDRWSGQIARIEPAGQETIGDRPCHRVRYRSIYGAEVTIYIDTATSLLLRCDIDATGTLSPPGTPSDPAAQEGPRLEVRYELFPAQVNRETRGASFDVVQPQGMRLVKQFQNQPQSSLGEPPNDDLSAAPPPAASPAPQNQSLVDLPAPEIRGVDLAGRRLEPADLAGKVTLLFFWSPDGGPDNLAAIQMIQRVADRFQDQPSVGILGIGGMTERPEIIGDLLRAKKATFRTVIDGNGLMMRSFGIQELPTFCIVASDGIIRHASSGASPEVEAALSEQIGALVGAKPGGSATYPLVTGSGA